MDLDKVQKGRGAALTEEAVKKLRKKKLIEGRKPNYFVSAKIVEMMNQKAVYTRNKGFSKTYYLDLILKSIKEHGFVSRQDINDLLLDKLPDWMTHKQRITKIGHLISELRMSKKIINQGTKKKSKWVIFQ